MASNFVTTTNRLSDPAFNAYTVTPANADLTYGFRALYVGTGGNVVIVTRGDNTVGPQTITFANVPGGTILPVMGTQVTTATTASNIVALY